MIGGQTLHPKIGCPGKSIVGMKRFLLVPVLFAASTLVLVDLVGLAAVFRTSRRLSGFSIDNRHYIYLESSRNSVTEIPLAQIQIIDVANNACVRNGCLKTDYTQDQANLSNKAAEDELLQRTASIRQSLRLNQLKVGLPLPIISRKTNPDRSETVQVRVSTQTQPMQILLQQRHLSPIDPGGEFTVDRASMRLVINYNNSRLTIGDLNNYRDAVQKYSIREVRLSPDRRNIVVLIDMTQPTYEGVVQTTFVQSFPI